MKYVLVTGLLLIVQTLNAQNFSTYPYTAAFDSVIDDYHGVLVKDPYRWLETPIDSSEAVKKWVEEQNNFTQNYLDAPALRKSIQSRLRTLWKSETHGLPVKAGDNYFYLYNDGTFEQSRVYMTKGVNGAPQLLLNPGEWSENNTTAITQIAPSPDGKYLAYAIQEGGSDWRTFKIVALETGKELPETIRWIKYSSVRWLSDGSGFFYSAFFDPQDVNHKNGFFNRRLYFHRLGTQQEEDELVFKGFTSPNWVATCRVTDDGKHLIIYYSDTQNKDAPSRIIVKNLENGNHTIIKEYVVDDFSLGYAYLDNIGSRLFFITSDKAENRKILSINMDNNSKDHLKWKEIIPESEFPILWTNVRGRHLLVHYLEDVQSKVKVFDTKGTYKHTIALPGIGILSGFSGSSKDNETYFSFSSLNRPKSIYRYTVNTNTTELYHRPDLPFEPNDIVTKQVFYHSKDGTKIPLFIMHKKDLEMDGKRPLLLHGYGGFGVTKFPSFQTRWLSWVDFGGIFAMANIRGGNEYGEAWHDAGKKANKQNVFDDFIAAAEYLIHEKYSCSEKLAIAGESNGGLLIGAVVNQRPDLFAAALPDVGVMDMLRFQLFNLGNTTTDEYGVSTKSEDFPYLYNYSPYHNIKNGIAYPAVMATTAANDNNVLPGHSMKYIARLQNAQKANRPILLRVEMEAGHFSGRSKAQLIQQYTDKWVFLIKTLEMDLDK
ncbi:MAG: prolyl oligopeptidase family serine peptidase [Bacteroidota bacterium]